MARSKLKTEESRINSTYQKKINEKDKVITRLTRTLRWRTKTYQQHQDFIKYLLEAGKVTKEELKEFYPKIPKEPSITIKKV